MENLQKTDLEMANIIKGFICTFTYPKWDYMILRCSNHIVCLPQCLFLSLYLYHSLKVRTKEFLFLSHNLQPTLSFFSSPFSMYILFSVVVHFVLSSICKRLFSSFSLFAQQVPEKKNKNYTWKVTKNMYAQYAHRILFLSRISKDKAQTKCEKVSFSFSVGFMLLLLLLMFLSVSKTIKKNKEEKEETKRKKSDKEQYIRSIWSNTHTHTSTHSNNIIIEN